MCGCTCTPRPCRRAHMSTRSCTARTVSRRPGPADEHRPWFGALGGGAGANQGGALLEPIAQGVDGKSADRQHPRLSALAEDAHGAVRKVDRRDIQVYQLAQAQTRRVEQLHDRFVARRQIIVRPKLEQAGHLVRIQRSRQTFFALRRMHVLRGVQLAAAFPEQKLVKCAHRRQSSLDAAPSQPPGMTGRGKGAQLRVLERAPTHYFARVAKRAQPEQIVAVGRNGMFAHPAFVLEMRGEALDPLALSRIHR